MNAFPLLFAASFCLFVLGQPGPAYSQLYASVYGPNAVSVVEMHPVNIQYGLYNYSPQPIAVMWGSARETFVSGDPDDVLDPSQFAFSLDLQRSYDSYVVINPGATFVDHLMIWSITWETTPDGQPGVWRFEPNYICYASSTPSGPRTYVWGQPATITVLDVPEPTLASLVLCAGLCLLAVKPVLRLPRDAGCVAPG